MKLGLTPYPFAGAVPCGGPSAVRRMIHKRGDKNAVPASGRHKGGDKNAVPASGRHKGRPLQRD
ncbi:MAG: hypothetical protein PUD15_02035 [Prevotella sp.]|nr:hypothetical protein [Prevotella sp.]